MRILRNYVLGELSYVFLMSLTIMTMLLVCGSVLTKMADLVINWGVDATLLFELFLFSTPFLFNFTIPMSVLIAVLLTFGKLSADQEITAMKASGISFGRLLKPILVAAITLSLACFLINDRISSSSHFRVRQLSSEIGMKTPASVLEEGVFIKHFANVVLFIHRIRQNQLEGIRIYQPQKDGPTRTIIAERGEIVSNPEKSVIKLKLVNGITEEPDAKDPAKFYKLKFDTYLLPLDISEFKFKEPLSKKPKEMSVSELAAEARRLKNDHHFIAYELLTEIQAKFAMSFAAVSFVLVGIPLAIRTRRSERSVGFAMALLLSTVYWSLFMGMSALGKTGKFPPILCMHFPNAFMLAASAFLMRPLFRS